MRGKFFTTNHKTDITPEKKMFISASHNDFSVYSLAILLRMVDELST